MIIKIASLERYVRSRQFHPPLVWSCLNSRETGVLTPSAKYNTPTQTSSSSAASAARVLEEETG